MENKICPECNTQNEAEYVYCKNCGFKFEEEPKTKTEAPKYDNFEGRRRDQNTGSNSNFEHQPQGFILDTIDGNPTDEVAAFVGKKAVEILPKFSKMELSRSKISWCWPPAVLGFLLGPLGAAIWFFYRKMYKVALILVAIGIVCGSCVSYLNKDAALFNEATMDSILEENLSGESIDFYGFFSDVADSVDATTYAATVLSDAVDAASCIFAGLFALYFYKSFVARKIYEYRGCGIDERYYKMGLASVGGTSGGMLAVGIVIYSLAQTLFDVIPNIF